ncbi:MAG: HAMP domain-containing protein, partial [Betaproteobacteria bacterium]|nr:HAMP domain-containing protein [Betaproteobacteria bacterium]
MRFGNRTTGGRLALGFGGLMTVMLMLIGLAVWNMAQIDGQLDKILGDNLRSSQLLNDMSEAAHTETTELRNLLLLSNSEREVVTNAQHVAAERKKYHEAHAILEKMPAATEDLALRKATDAAALAARRVNDEIIQLARTHHTSEALELLRTQGGAVTAAWQTALDAEIEHQKQENAKAGTQAHQQYVRTISILGLTVFAGLLMAFFIARTTTRSVTLPVAQAMEAAERIAGGDLGRPIHTRSADELGRMLAALEKMRLGPAHSVT